MADSKFSLALPSKDRMEQRKRQFKREIKEGKTADGLSLEARRDTLQLYVAELHNNIAMLQDPEVDVDVKKRISAEISIGSMAGLLEGITFLADCVSSREKHKFKRKSDGKTVAKQVTLTTDMAAGNIERAGDYTAFYAKCLAFMIRDFLLLQMDPAAAELVRRKWQDENDLWRCPYFDDKEDKDAPEDPEDEPEDPEATAAREKSRKDVRAVFGSLADEIANRKAK